MKMMNLCVLLLAGLAPLSLVGCSSEPAVEEANVPPAAADAGAEHAHSEEEHAHSEEGHVHDAGPHGGTLADWGGGAYHVEFTVDHDQQETVVYILGADAQTPQPIAASGDSLLLSIVDPAFQVDLAADPLPGEAAGTSSRYVGQHPKLGTVQEFAGTISGEVDGTPYVGEFEEHPHAAH